MSLGVVTVTSMFPQALTTIFSGVQPYWESATSPPSEALLKRFLNTVDDSYMQYQEFSAGTFVSDRIEGTNLNKQIPMMCNITGISVNVKQKEVSSNDAYDGLVRLIVGGSMSGNDKARASSVKWPTDPAWEWVNYGADGDLWGLSNLTEKDINGVNFGYAVAGTINNGSLAIDAINIEVSYNPVGMFLAI